MSVADAKKFLDHVDQDPKLKKSVGKSLSAIVKTAQTQGYTFSKADMQKHLTKRWGTKKRGGVADADECTICI